MPVIVKRTTGHAVSADLQPVVFGDLFYCDGRLDAFKKIHMPYLRNFLTVSARLPEYTEKKPINRKILLFCKKIKNRPAILQKCKNFRAAIIHYFILILFHFLNIILLVTIYRLYLLTEQVPRIVTCSSQMFNTILG